MAVPQRFYRAARAVIRAAVLGLVFHPVFGMAEETWHVCQPFEKRVTCIVDGDTLWYRGEKMRLKDIDTPEVDGECRREQRLAAEVTQVLLNLISSGIVEIKRFGPDDYGRTLVRIETRAGQPRFVLLASGLADRFGDGIETDWCR